MQNLTAEELLASIGIPINTKHHQPKELGTEFNLNDNVVIYSNTNSNSKRNGIRTRIDYNTSVDNLDASSTPLSPASPAQAPEVKEVQGIPGDRGEIGSTEPIGYKRLSVHDKYVEIGVQIGNVRTEGRYMRAKVYISLKTDTDRKYSVFLAGAATNCLTELKRGTKENLTVLSTIETLWEEHPKCMIARLHYKPVRCQTTNFHRKLLKHAMISIYTNEDDELEAMFYLLDEWIKIPLNNEVTEKQSKFYQAAGIWRNDMDQFEDDEELS
jgi:hypothetical protein